MVGEGGGAIRCCNRMSRSQEENVDLKSVIITVIVSNSETMLKCNMNRSRLLVYRLPQLKYCYIRR